jgi:hypothetical protein
MNSRPRATLILALAAAPAGRGESRLATAEAPKLVRFDPVIGQWPEKRSTLNA